MNALVRVVATWNRRQTKCMDKAKWSRGSDQYCSLFSSLSCINIQKSRQDHDDETNQRMQERDVPRRQQQAIAKGIIRSIREKQHIAQTVVDAVQQIRFEPFLRFPEREASSVVKVLLEESQWHLAIEFAERLLDKQKLHKVVVNGILRHLSDSKELPIYWLRIKNLCFSALEKSVELDRSSITNFVLCASRTDDPLAAWALMHAQHPINLPPDVEVSCRMDKPLVVPNVYALTNLRHAHVRGGDVQGAIRAMWALLGWHPESYVRHSRIPIWRWLLEESLKQSVEDTFSTLECILFGLGEVMNRESAIPERETAQCR